MNHNLVLENPDLAILGPGLACECKENCLRDLEDVPCSSSLIVHLVFKKSSAYAFLSLLMCDQNSAMLHFCQRHFNSSTSISSIFIIDLITKLLNIKFMTTFFKRERLPSFSSPHYCVLISISESNVKYFCYTLDLIITCTSAKNLWQYSELKRAVFTLAWMI